MIRLQLTLPDDFRQRNINTFGPAGATWLENLPEIIAMVKDRWSLAVDPPFNGLSYNFVAPARRADGTEVVLKVGVPRQELNREIEALRIYQGRGSVRLIDANPQAGILLLERIRPGLLLSSLCAQDDDQATIIAAGIMKDLWRPMGEDHPFQLIQDWFAGLKRLRKKFAGGTGPFPEKLVDTAEKLYAELIAAMDAPVLLHGDLHHFNILSASRQPWLAIDPKGVVGEAAYDAGALLRNPIPDIMIWENLGRILQRRIDILSEVLGIDPWKIKAWGLAQGVLSIWWSYEDNDPQWEFWLPFAEKMAELHL